MKKNAIRLAQRCRTEEYPEDRLTFEDGAPRDTVLEVQVYETVDHILRREIWYRR